LIFFEIGSCCVPQAGLELTVLLPSPPQCWDCRDALPNPRVELFLKLKELTVIFLPSLLFDCITTNSSLNSVDS
jgi:hypothetical protein